MVDINPSRKEGKRDTGVQVKLFSIIGLTTIFAFLSNYLFNEGEILYGIVALLVFLTLFAIEVLMVSDRKILISGVLLNAIVFAIPFIKLFSLYYFVAFLIFTAFLIAGAIRSRRDMDNMIKIRFPRLIRIVSNMAVTGIVLFLATVVILNSGFSISKQNTEKAIGFAEPIVGRFIEGFSADKNTGQLLEDMVNRQLSSNKAFASLSPTEREVVVVTQVGELKLEFERRIGTTINLDKTVSENVYEIIDKRISSLTPRAQLYWSLILILAIWISVQSLEILIYIPLLILVFLVYELMFALKLAEIGNLTKSKEVISLK